MQKTKNKSSINMKLKTTEIKDNKQLHNLETNFSPTVNVKYTDDIQEMESIISTVTFNKIIFNGKLIYAKETPYLNMELSKFSYYNKNNEFTAFDCNYFPISVFPTFENSITIKMPNVFENNKVNQSVYVPALYGMVTEQCEDTENYKSLSFISMLLSHEDNKDADKTKKFIKFICDK